MVTKVGPEISQEDSEEVSFDDDGDMTPPDEHHYLRTHRISGQSLRFRIPGNALALDERARSSKTGRAGETLVKEGALRITQVALRTGATLGSHQVAGPLSVQVLRGRLRMTTTDGEVWLEGGELVVLDGGVAHAAEAMSDCALLITMAMPHVVPQSSNSMDVEPAIRG